MGISGPQKQALGSRKVPVSGRISRPRTTPLNPALEYAPLAAAGTGLTVTLGISIWAGSLLGIAGAAIAATILAAFRSRLAAGTFRVAAAAVLSLSGIFAGIEMYSLLQSHPINTAVLQQAQRVSDLLAQDDYPGAVQQVKTIESSLKYESEPTGQKAALLDAQYAKLDAWLTAKYGQLNPREHDVLHALLLAFSSAAESKITFSSITVDGDQLRLVAQRADEAADTPVPQLPALTAGDQPPPPDTVVVQTPVAPQTPIFLDSIGVVDLVFRQFSPIESVEIKWERPHDRSIRATFAQKRGGTPDYSDAGSSPAAP